MKTLHGSARACPVVQCQAEIDRLSAALLHKVLVAHRLVQSHPCAACAAGPETCPAQAGFSQALHHAIQQVADEWTLGELLRGCDGQ